MNALQVKQSTDLMSIAEQSGAKLHKAGSVWQSACPLHGGDNRSAFTIYIGNDGLQHYKCFTRDECNEHGSDVIAFVMTRDGCDFKTALKTLGGDLEKGFSLPVKPRPVVKPRVAVVPTQEWQDKAIKRANRANDMLFSERGEVGRKYLEQRGFTVGTMYANLLGYESHTFDVCTQTNRPAIVIPHLDTGDVITAVKFRFIDDQAKQKDFRFTQIGGGTPNLFGLQHVMHSDNALMFVEGEFNALSVWQAVIDKSMSVSVVSAGTENIKDSTIEILKRLALRYSRFFIWMDSKSAETQEKIGLPAKLIKSPELRGKKYDANEMLKEGLLDGFIERTIR